LNQIVDIAQQEQPDVIVIAGDVYDRSMPPSDAVQLFDEIMFRFVIEQKRNAIIIAGNHDSPERMNLHHRIIEKHNLHIAGNVETPIKTVPIKDEFGEVTFYVVPYIEPEAFRYQLGNDTIKTHQHVYDEIIRSIGQTQKKGERSVLVGHAFFTGGQSTESERLLAVGGAECISANTLQAFHYTALGHLHTPQDISGNKIRYSGSILKYSLSEVAHTKSVTICTLDQQGAINHKIIPLIPKRDMHKVSGSIIDRKFKLATGQNIPAKEDFLQVILMNDQPVHDAMRIIQDSFPNTLALDWQKKQVIATEQRSFTSTTIRQLSPLELFEEFYKASTGDKMEDIQKESVHRVIQEVEKGAVA
jgi:exonuclease SbcD